MMLTIFVLAIIITCVAMMLAEGLWSNTLSLVNAILAAMIASNSFEMVATFLEEYFPSFTYWLDFLALWGVFTLSYAVIRELTDRLSRTRVRFKKPIEQFGRIGVAALTGWIVVCFFLFSLHTAPLVRKSFGGAFGQSPAAPNFYFSPDHLWLGFMQSRSEGALATSPPNVFDPKSEFILKYGERRERYSKLPFHRVRADRGARFRRPPNQ